MNKGSENYMYYRFPKSFYLDIETREDLDIIENMENSRLNNILDMELEIDEEYANEIVTIM